MAERDETPPYHPTYSVHLTDAQIKAIFTSIFDRVKVSKIAQLERGQSYNNRIYFVSVVVDQIKKDYALKVSGHFFDDRKVQNEVVCLLKVAEHCSDIPTPRVLAWSLNGRSCERISEIVTNGQNLIQTQHRMIPKEYQQNRSWILLERLSGMKLNIEEPEIGTDKYKKVMQQLAGLVHLWRTKIPPQRTFGNLLLVQGNHKIDGQSIYTIDTRGLLLCDYHAGTEILSKIGYFEARIENSLATLEKKPDLFPKPHKETVHQILSPILSPDTFSNLDLFNNKYSDQRAIFTHYDFSPRNILVAHDEISNELRVTGILDFEFAGFFPVEEDFTNDAVGNEGDWPTALYNEYLETLARLGSYAPPLANGMGDGPKEIVDASDGAQLPQKEFLARVWREAVLLTRIIENVAPWQIAAGHYQGSELEGKLAESLAALKRDVEELMSNLKR